MAQSSEAGMNGIESQKQAACLNCRRSKLKCFRNDGATSCVKCQQRDISCVTPPYHVGRHKGVKNKRSGLDKAVHQIEQALKKSKASNSASGCPRGASDLQDLLSKSQELLPRESQDSSASNQSPNGQTSSHSPVSSRGLSNHVKNYGTASSEPHDEDDSLNVDDAENPLQLLARTSELLSTQRPSASPQNTPAQPFGSALSDFMGDSADDKDFQTFFGRFNPRPDLGPEFDPIDMGLVTLPESETLFNFFYENLAHSRWGMDPVIHTTKFVRSRSAFLFTSILAASALFIPSTAALSRRLTVHCRKLAHLVMENRFRSVEIVLAFMVNIPWLSPREHWADDETCSYLAMALTIALDLSLNKIAAPAFTSLAKSNLLDQEGISRSDCIDSRKALAMDGFDGVDPSSLLGRRLLRRRERTWLSLFVLERGVCLARGRNYTLPMTPLVETCDNWHVCEISDKWDGSIISVAVLRRDLAGLIDKIRSICDGHGGSALNGSAIVPSLKKEIENFFDRWYLTWPFQIGDKEQYNLPPYVEILASHTRLSMYSSVINHPTASVDVKHFFRTAGLSSALNVLRTAVQGEGQLKSMPNNTAIMISFAACFALGISTSADGSQSGLAPSVRALIAETADVLERIGATPEHRKGVSALYASQLRRILRLSPRPVHANVQANQQLNGMTDVPILHDTTPLSRQQDQITQPEGTAETLLPAPLPFSGMSNDQIDEVIKNTGIGLDALWDDFQFDETTDLGWLDWST